MQAFVYFNLHRKLFSIRAAEGKHKGRVVAHCTSVTLREATFKVSEAGRQRVLAEQKKNVHAGVLGHIDSLRGLELTDHAYADHWLGVQLGALSEFDRDQPEAACTDAQAITYNPYKFDAFVTVDGHRAITRAGLVRMTCKGTSKGLVAGDLVYRDQVAPAAPATVTRESAPIKARSSVIWAGPSRIDGSPIAVVATIGSSNSKTGDMVQTWIIRSDMSPLEASRTGADVAICGQCPHRGQVVPGAKMAQRRTCYVNIGQAPLGVYKALARGSYPVADSAEARAAIGRGRMVRIGSYGDGAAVPDHVWSELTSEATGKTAYTHQAGHMATAPWYMTSADSLAAAETAWSIGRRTFRIVQDRSDLVQGREIECPSARGVKCADCGLCDATRAARSIAIVAHGTGAKYFGAVQ